MNHVVRIRRIWEQSFLLKPVFHLANLFARREAKTRIRQRDWLTLVGEKIRREQVGTVPTFFSVRANKFAKWKTGLKCKEFSGGSSVSQNKLPQLILGYIYILKYLQSNFIG